MMQRVARFGFVIDRRAHVSSPQKRAEAAVRPLGRGTAFVVARHLYGEPQVDMALSSKRSSSHRTVTK